MINTSIFRGGLKAEQRTITLAPSGHRVLTPEEAGFGFLEFTGTLAASVTVQFPVTLEDTGLIWNVSNQTSGAFAIVIETPQGGEFLLAPGQMTSLALSAGEWEPVGSSSGGPGDAVTPEMYGAEGFGATITAEDVAAHAEGSRYPWRGSYVVGVDTKDYVGIQEAVYACFGGPLDDDTPTGFHKAGYAYLNRRLDLGNHYLINRRIEMQGVVGFHVRGMARDSTWVEQITENTDGWWCNHCSYGVMENIIFTTSPTQDDTVALLQLDSDGTVGAYKTQQITVRDMEFRGSTRGARGVQISRSGGGAQGDTILFSNCLWNGCTEAGLMIGDPLAYGFNALSIQVINGNFQGCTNYGIASYAGSFFVDGVSCQNSHAHTFEQTGCDFYAAAPIAPCCIKNIRSESTRLAKGPMLIENCLLQVNAVGWYNANGDSHLGGTAVVLNTAVTGTTVGGDGKIYRVTTAGTLGGLGLTAPTSATSSTVTVTGAGWTTNAFAGYKLSIISGTGAPPQWLTPYLDGEAGQSLVIASNTATTITLVGTFTTTPDTTSRFVVEPDWNGGVINSGTAVLTCYDYYTVEGAQAIINSQLLGGYVTLVGGSALPPMIDNVLISRGDALGNLYDGDRTVQIRSVLRVGSPIFGHAPQTVKKYRIPSADGDLGSSQLNDYCHMNIGWQRLASSGASTPLAPSDRYMDLVFGRADGVRGDSAFSELHTRNAWWVQGTLSGKFGSGVNQAGGDIYLQGGPSTGNGAPGGVKVLGGAAAGSGSALNLQDVIAGWGSNRLFFCFKGANVASAAAIVPSGNSFHITGVVTITSITATGVTAGTDVTLIFDGSCQVTDGSNLKLAGDFNATADDVLRLHYDGASFFEVSRSVN